MNESSLRQIFGTYGKIINVKILRDERTGQLRGTAFVRFDRKDQAETAISALNGTHLTGSTEPLAVKVSEEHGKQKAVQIKTGLIPAPLPIAPAPHPYFESYSGGYSNQSSSSRHFGVDSLTLSAPYFDPGYRSRSPTLINPAFFSGQQSSGSYGYLEERSRGGGPMRGERDGSRWNDRQGSSGGGGHYDRRGNGRGRLY
jgi:RNA recognition motif-containing protein